MASRSITAPALVRQLGAWRADGAGAVYRRLADGLRLLILDGRLPLDLRLPGERELAAALGVSRTTVSGAFALLREQGYLRSRQGSGSRTSLPGEAPGRSGEPRADDERPGVVDLGIAALPAIPEVHGAYAAALAALPAQLPGHGYEPVGLPVLREAIADRYRRRGLPTTPDQIVVTCGAQHAFALVLRLLTGPGDRVILDHPVYPHAIDAVQRAACRVVPVALPEQGWDVEGLIAAMRQTGPRLAYLLPDFQNPTGRCMDAATRAAVAHGAARTRTTLVVDETMVDLWLDGAPPPPLAVHDPGGTVITLGSTGKSFWGGLRIGWIRADVRTAAALATVRSSLDLGTPVLEQLAAATLVGGDDALLDPRRAVLREQRRHLLGLVAEQLPEWRVVPPPGGLALWAELPVAVSSALAATAERYGVRIVAGPRFGATGALERFVRLPFTRPPAELDLAIPRLARAYAALRPADAASAALGVGEASAAVV